MISAAVKRRSNNSQSGVRAGVSSRLANPSSKRKGGKITRLGAGGVTRSKYQIAGNTAKAVNIQGDAKLSAPNMIYALAIIAGIPPRLA
jgi:hypothetical protein